MATRSPNCAGPTRATCAVRAARAALALALVLGTAPGARAQTTPDCGSGLVPDGSCAAGGGGGGGDTGASPLNPDAPFDPGSAGADPLAPPSTVGNPVSLFTGNKREIETDFAVPGAELVFRRTYNSDNEPWRSGIGQGWSHTYAVSIFATPEGAREILQSDGRRLHFTPAGTDAAGRTRFRSRSVFEGTIVAEPDGAHRWELPDGRRLAFNGSFLTGIDWPDQRRLSLYYRQQRLASVTDETGRVLRFAYWPGAPGNTRALGGFEAQDFGAAAGQLSTLTLPDGTEVHYEYDDRSNLTRVRYPGGTHRQYHYENEGYPSHLTGLTDRTGVRYATWAYDAAGRAVLSEHAGGVGRVQIEHPDAAAVEAGRTVGTRVTNSLGQSSLYTWEQPVGGSPRMLEATGSRCASCPPTGMRWAYDEQGRLSGATITGDGTAVGTGTTQYAYDEVDRLVAVRHVAPDGTITPIERREYATPSDLEPIRIARPSVNPQQERITIFERDRLGRVTSVTERGWSPTGLLDGPDPASDLTPTGFEPIERTVRYGYSDGALTTIDGPRDDAEDVARFEYDASNRLVAIATPLSPTLRIGAFDAQGRVTAFSVGTQSPVSLSYAANGRPARIEQRGRAITFAYDPQARLTGFTGPDGQSTRLVYGPSGELIELVDAAGRRTTFDIDDEGRTVGQVELGADGTMIRSVATLFDALGRVASTTYEQAPPGGGNAARQTHHNGYDAAGRLGSVADAATGDRVEVTRTDLGELAAISEPDGTDTAFAFDAAGQEIALTDARDNRTVYLKDDFARVVLHRSPDTGTTAYRYDAAGNRTERVDANGITTGYAWDAANRMVEKSSRGAEGDELDTHRYAYDSASGKLIESTSPATTERFGFDAEFRLIEHERLIDDQRFTTTYRYDERGRIEVKGLPDGQTLRHHYHEDGPMRGQLRAITRESLFGLSQQTIVGEIDTDERDGSTGHLSHNGLATRREHGPDGRLLSLSIDETLQLDYTFDAAGRITGLELNGQYSRYDWGRSGLIGANTAAGVYRFDYDASGNRTASAIERPDGTSQATAYRYPAEGEGNRLLGTDMLISGGVEASGTGTATDNGTDRTLESDTDEYLYDGAGAPLAARAGLEYAYDAERRPISVRENGQLLAEYAYNGFGERIRKVVYRGDAKRITYFLYDGHQLAAEIRLDDDGSLGALRQGVFVDEHPVAYLIGRAVYAVHTDQLGTPHRVTDESGSTVWAAAYDPFGRAELSIETIELPYRLPGQYADAETGTHYNYYRDYDPATGRYLTSDPIGLQGGLNTYRYAENDPLGMSDPLGLFPGDDAPDPTFESPTGTPDKPSAEDEQFYADKLTKVLQYAYEALSDGERANQAAADFVSGLIDNALIIGGMMAALVVAQGTPAAPLVDGVLLVGALLLAGYEGGTFLVGLVEMGIELANTGPCDEGAFRQMGDQLADSILRLSSGIAESVLLGALGRLSDVVKSAKDFAGDGVLALWRNLRSRLGMNRPQQVAGLCSFAGDTLVATRTGYRPIEQIEPGRDEVWARDEATGESGWRAVLARYQNRYEYTVRVSASDANGHGQTITSNRIHPYFARIAASALIATSSVTTTASEGHVYTGEIEGGAWVDAQHLQAGDELLSDDGSWQTVASVEIEAEPLDAFNLTVEGYSTYFVAEDVSADAVWVHNACRNLPDDYTATGQLTDFGRPVYAGPKSGDPELFEGRDRKFYGSQGNSPDDPDFYNIPGPRYERVNKADAAADELAGQLGGVSRIKFPGYFDDREFDLYSDQYIGQSKPANFDGGSQWRKQAKATFEAAIEFGRTPYFHFQGPPHRDVVRKIEEYASRYGVTPVIDIDPL